MTRHINYFGYGAMEHPLVIKTLLGRIPGSEPASLQNYGLYIQKLVQVTDEVAAGQQESPQALLRRVWGPEFHSYTILPLRQYWVTGTLWKLTECECELVQEWELVGAGWNDELWVPVNRHGKARRVRAMTQRIRDGQIVERRVEYTREVPLLVDRDKLVEVATQFRSEFTKRVEV